MRSINNRKKRNVAIVASFFLFHIIFFFIIRYSNVYSNEEIISNIQEHLKKYRSYTVNIVSIIMSIEYSYKFSVHYHHGGEHLFFSDSVPLKLDNYLTQYTPIDFNDYVIRYYPNNVCKFEYWSMLNKDRHNPCLVYSFIDEESLLNFFPNCRLYFPPEIPTEESQWLYKLEDNWYIYSP